MAGDDGRDRPLADIYTYGVVMAYAVMGYVVMAHIVMAYVVMALYSCGR